MEINAYNFNYILYIIIYYISYNLYIDYIFFCDKRPTTADDCSVVAKENLHLHHDAKVQDLADPILALVFYFCDKRPTTFC